MAEHEAKEGVLTDADLATYGIPPKQTVRPAPVKSYATTTKRKDKMMKPSTQDRTEGKLHEVKGKVKEEVGKATNDPDLEISGEAEKNAGKVQNWVGRAEKAVGE
ncbi:MAG: CsbD family protein [Terriglobales bacterium]